VYCPGTALAAEALSGISEIGNELKRAGMAMSGFGGLTGAVLLVLALYRLIQGVFLWKDYQLLP
jgi:hypothetical protein